MGFAIVNLFRLHGEVEFSCFHSILLGETSVFSGSLGGKETADENEPLTSDSAVVFSSPKLVRMFS